jgi:hypothetical protein
MSAYLFLAICCFVIAVGFAYMIGWLRGYRAAVHIILPDRPL